MFEPENDIERLLMRASTQPSERPAFARAIMDAEVFVVLVPDRPIVPGPDGNTTIPEGTKLSLPSAVRGEEQLIPFFTAPSRARAWYPGDHIVAPERTRDLFGRYPGTPFVLNPGSDYGKDFTPPEVQRMLAGQFDAGPANHHRRRRRSRYPAGASQGNSDGFDRGAGAGIRAASNPCAAPG